MGTSCPPVRWQEVVEHVVHGDRAEQPAVGVAHRDADHVVRRQPGGQLPLRHFRPDEESRLDAVADQDRRRAAQQPLEAHAAQVPPGRRQHGGLADVDLRGQRGGLCLVPDPGEHFGYRRVRREGERLGCHQAARRLRVVPQQPP
jgi:hypothetical protein